MEGGESTKKRTRSTKDDDSDAPKEYDITWLVLVCLIFDLFVFWPNGYSGLVFLPFYGLLTAVIWGVTAVIALGNTAMYVFCIEQSILPCPYTADRLAEIGQALRSLAMPTSGATLLV